MRHARHLLFLATLAALPAHAQSVSPAWDAYRARQQTSDTTPVASTRDAAVSTTTTVAAGQPAPVPAAPSRTAGSATAEATSRGAFFIAGQFGQAWIHDDVRQDTTSIGAGYRWQAGPVVQVGIEGVAGRIDGTTFTEAGGTYRADSADYASLGANARFQLGASPMFAVTRLGYWYADAGEGDSVDGGYAGVGLGVDFNRHVNLTLAYTYHAYASSYVYRDRNYRVYGTTINRADLVTLGLEARF